MTINGTPLGAGISVDGAPGGTLPHTLRVENGTHRITVSSDPTDPENTIFRETTVENVLDGLGEVEFLRITEEVTE